MKKTHTLSTNKHAFMFAAEHRISRIPNQSQRLSGKQMICLCDQYNKKLNIRIYFNGTTDIGKQILAELTGGVVDIRPFLLKPGDWRYYQLLEHYPEYRFILKKAEHGSEAIINTFDHNSTDNALPPLIDLNNANPSLEPENSPSDGLVLLGKILEKNPNIRKELDYAIDRCKSRCYELFDKNLSTEQALIEMLAIQQTLSEDETAGYIFSNESRESEYTHYEVFLITKDQLIRPVRWGSSDKLTSAEIYSPHLKTMIDANGAQLNDFKDLFTAQAGYKECSTLGLQYLKQLLKEKAFQFNTLSLTIQYYDKSGDLENFFLPSPQTLIYSQSTTFNEILAAFVSGGGELSTKKGNLSITNLRELLKDSMKIAEGKEDKAVLLGNQQLLERFDDFSREWLQIYETVMAKRELMDRKDESYGRNKYLNYTTHRMVKKCLEAELQETGTKKESEHGRTLY